MHWGIYIIQPYTGNVAGILKIYLLLSREKQLAANVLVYV